MFYRIINGNIGSDIALRFENAFEALELFSSAEIGAILVKIDPSSVFLDSFIAKKVSHRTYSFNESDCGEKDVNGFYEYQQTHDMGYCAYQILKHNNHIDYVVFDSYKKFQDFCCHSFIEENDYYPDDIASGEVMLFLPKEESYLNGNWSPRKSPRFLKPVFSLENFQKKHPDVVAIF